MTEEKCIRISVRNLVEFILREGDIDQRVSGTSDKDAMLMGGRLHRKIQRSMGSEYQAEVPLKIQIPCDGFSLQIEGRADGIIVKEEKRNQAEPERKITVDEIKGVLRDLDRIESPVTVHLAQAKCYAYIYAKQNQVPVIGVQMTYCNLDTEEIKRFVQTYHFGELEEWFEKLVRAYEKWAKLQIEWEEKRNQTIRQLEFPFPYREGQFDLAASVYRTILRKKKLFIQAPTGTGKTLAVLYPAVKAIGEGLGEKLFYLTAKTITRTVAEQAFERMKEKGLQFRAITLTAKEKICFCEEKECNPEICPYAKGHFDRVNDAVYDLLRSEKNLDRKTLEEQAVVHQVCPFELSLDASIWADGIICDYNYVFDPNAHLKRFFAEGTKGEYLFLIDEAHNLVERGREMYSATLYKEDVLSVKKLVRTRDKKLAKSLEAVNWVLLELKRECENYRTLESVSVLSLKMMNLLTELERYLDEQRGTEGLEKKEQQEITELFFQARNFLNIYDILDDHYVIYTELEADGRFKIKLFCVNPAANLQSYLDQGNSTIYFSATLLPIHYYKKLLSTEPDDYAIYAESTFAPGNRLVLFGTDVSTKYTRRGEEMYWRIAEYIRRFVEEKQGNYMVFFPSYRFMEDVWQCFLNMNCDADVILQSQSMNETQREEFLDLFEQDRTRTLIGFCVMGGIFSEGIDLSEDRLIGAVIVGTGIPQVCNDREIVRQYFENQGLRGFDYAYLYPGMNKVLQSAGRVIRTENDRGAILLLDDRFLSGQYQPLFPREWQQNQICRLDSIGQCLEKFWKQKDEK